MMAAIKECTIGVWIGPHEGGEHNTADELEVSGKQMEMEVGLFHSKWVYKEPKAKDLKKPVMWGRRYAIVFTKKPEEGGS